MSASKKTQINRMRAKGVRKNGVIPGYAWDFVPGRNYDARALGRKYAARGRERHDHFPDTRDVVNHPPSPASPRTW